MSDALRIGAILLLVLGNAIFVAAEYALVTARRNRLEERSAKGGRAARTALHLMDDPVRLISTVQIAITVFGIALGAVGEPLGAGYFGGLPRSLAFVLSFAVLTYLSVALGELIPKALALQKAEAIADYKKVKILKVSCCSLKQGYPGSDGPVLKGSSVVS